MFTASAKRLNKFISESGICSRREADRFIEQGNVYINGKRAQVGDQVTPGDQVRVNGQLIDPMEAEHLVLIALNKPVGIECTTENKPNNIVDFVNHGVRIFPIGRLDKDSQGLIFLTNNGDLVNKVLRAGNNHEKEYLVTVNKPITPAFVDGMAGGVPILGTKTKKCPVEKVSSHVFRITLVQGLNRQIRRMCEYFGYDAVQLERVRIMNVGLKGLPTGEWRDLTENELATLMSAVEDSSSEKQPGAKKAQRPNRGNSRSSSQKQTNSARSHQNSDGKKPKGKSPSRKPGGKSATPRVDKNGRRSATGKRVNPKAGAGRGGAPKGGKRTR